MKHFNQLSDLAQEEAVKILAKPWLTGMAQDVEYDNKYVAARLLELGQFDVTDYSLRTVMKILRLLANTIEFEPYSRRVQSGNIRYYMWHAKGFVPSPASETKRAVTPYVLRHAKLCLNVEALCRAGGILIATEADAKAFLDLEASVIIPVT